MDWSEVVEAARAISWVAYIATADAEGRPHSAAVAPGFSEGTIWFGTRPGSRKWRNLRVNPEAAFHWPVATGTGPGELAAWGRATLHESPVDRERIWHSGVMPYDLSGFWKGPDDPDLVFGEVAVSRARLFTAEEGRPVRKVWRPA